jgi:hypothetical protein
VLAQGQFYVVVPGKQQQRELITEISRSIMETDMKRVHLSVCQYIQAQRPEAQSLWTYTTDWALA